MYVCVCGFFIKYISSPDTSCSCLHVLLVLFPLLSDLLYIHLYLTCMYACVKILSWEKVVHGLLKAYLKSYSCHLWDSRYG